MSRFEGSVLLLCGPPVAAVVIAAALWGFATRDVNWFSFVASVFGFTLAFSIVVLVPYDLWQAVAVHGDRHPVQAHLHLLHTGWILLYWTLSLFCWFVLPVLIEYEGAPDFTAKERLRTSLRANVRFYAICAGIAMAAIIALIFGGVHQTSSGALGAWCMAASNTWGLLLLTILMGYGLVALPNYLWHSSDPHWQLRELYGRASAHDEARLSANLELHVVVGGARMQLDPESQPASDTGGPLEGAFASVRETLDDCEKLCARLDEGGSAAKVPTYLLRNMESPRGGPEARVAKLAQLRSALKARALEARRADCRWKELVFACQLLAEVDEGRFRSAGDLAVGRGDGRLSGCASGIVALWYRLLRPLAFRAAAVVCGFLSVFIALGQLLLLCDAGCWCGTLSLLFCRDFGPFRTQVLCMVPLSYMVFTAFWSMFRIKVPGWYGFYGNHNTDTGSLLWCSSIMARLATPLCYHFLLLSHVKNTKFEEFMGQITEVPVLGLDDFNRGFPVLVGLLCLCNLFGVYSRFARQLGLSSLDFDQHGEEDDHHVTQGKALVQQAQQLLKTRPAPAVELAEIGTEARPKEPPSPRERADPEAQGDLSPSSLSRKLVSDSEAGGGEHDSAAPSPRPEGGAEV